MNNVNPANWEAMQKQSLKDGGLRRSFPMSALEARTAAGALVLTAGTVPLANVTSSNARVRWVVTDTVGVIWKFGLAGEYAERDGSASGARFPDEVSFIFTMQGGITGNVFAPTIIRTRAGVADATITPTAVKVALTMAALEAAAEVVATTFTLSASPSQPELVQVIFRGKGLKHDDTLQLALTPNAALASTVDLFGLTRREIVHAAQFTESQR